MTKYFRFLPAFFGALVLVGSILPYCSTGPQTVSLLNLPGTYAQAATAMNMFGGGPLAAMNGPRNQHSMQDGAEAAAVISKTLYIVPLFALMLIVLNLRGLVSRAVQLFAGIVWGAITLAVPYIAAQILIESNPLLKSLSSLAGSGPNFEIGAWLILLASVGICLSALGIIRDPGARVPAS